MREPSNADFKRRLKKYYQMIATIQASCIGDIENVREFIISQLPLIEKGVSDYELLKNYIVEKYTQMFLGLKDDITKAYNESGKIEVGFLNNTAGAVVVKDLLPVKVLPNSKAFKITNRILNEKAISIRSSKMAKQVTSLIGESFENELSIQQIQKKLDIALGYRDKAGLITPKAKKLIIDGKFTHRNGHIYDTYRIARTEIMRISHVQTTEIYRKLIKKGFSCRLKMVATLDDRTRTQSRKMNGYFANKEGKFKYPDGNRYFIYEAPPQWSINDREAILVVFDR